MNRSTSDTVRSTMSATLRCRLLITLAAVLLLVAGCGKHAKPSQQTPAAAETQQQAVAPAEDSSPAADQAEGAQAPTCRDEEAIRQSERNRAACYHLQPGVTTTRVVKRQVPVKHGKHAAAAKKGAKTTAKTHTVTETVHHTTRCQPQCLIYARCRTGINTCKLGDTGPVQWFGCAAKNGATTSLPHTGSVMILAGHSGHRMSTGHVIYVEEAKKGEGGIWHLRLSHTNYDRKCHLDLDAKALFDPKQMTVTFETGPWAPWGKHLKVLGFILR